MSECIKPSFSVRPRSAASGASSVGRPGRKRGRRFPGLSRRLALVFGGVALGIVAQESRANPFPFVLPWDDASTGITDVSGWLAAPLGPASGVSVGAEGHFEVAGRRIRFLGVNVSFAGGLPKPEEAAAIAARLARFGVNVVRFHHLDTRPWPDGICDPNGADSGTLHPEALARLDAFIAELKQHGIYVNLNLLVGRPFDARDGLPKAIESMDWKDRHLIGFFDPVHREAQEKYARRLLGHRNPLTGLTYAEDPAVAFVEINNEQGLVHGWLGGRVDALPEVFRQSLDTAWQAWLKQRYGSDAELNAAWEKGGERLGNERLTNPAFTQDLTGWTVEQHEGASLGVRLVRNLPPAVQAEQPWARAVRLDVYSPGTAGWHLQFNQPGLALREESAYTVSFWARANAARTLSANVTMAHEPWQSLGFAARPELTDQWQLFTYVFRPTQDDANARLGFSDFGPEDARVWLAGISLRPGGIAGLKAGERLAGGTVPGFTRAGVAGRSPAAQQDWMRFLTETEDAYWQAMYRFLRQDLGVRALITGTIAGCSPLNSQAKLDWVDTHAYWQHPRFPNRPWDAEDWVVENRSMVNEAGGRLPDLAFRRVIGKPHAVTEYNHPAPNTYSSEAFLLLAAYGALQDWDAIYVYSYAHSRPDGWDTRKINGFFDIDQHPTKMVTLPVAAALFRRGDVAPARELVGDRLDWKREVALLRGAQSWNLVSGTQLGFEAPVALMHRVGLATEGVAMPPGVTPPESLGLAERRYAADTGELTWDLRERGNGLVTINTAHTKAVIGWAFGRRIDLNGIRIDADKGLQEGWCAITVTAMEGRLPERGRALSQPTRVLVTATGYAENTGMKWKDAAKSSVGRDWGGAPSRVEGVSARLSFPVHSDRVQAWALDPRGQRQRQLPVSASVLESSLIELGPEWLTLWYEVEIQP